MSTVYSWRWNNKWINHSRNIVDNCLKKKVEKRNKVIDYGSPSLCSLFQLLLNEPEIGHCACHRINRTGVSSLLLFLQGRPQFYYDEDDITVVYLQRTYERERHLICFADNIIYFGYFDCCYSRLFHLRGIYGWGSQRTTNNNIKKKELGNSRNPCGVSWHTTHVLSIPF